MWQIRSVRNGHTAELMALGREGWEPFSVTENNIGATIWFRKKGVYEAPQAQAEPEAHEVPEAEPVPVRRASRRAGR